MSTNLQDWVELLNAEQHVQVDKLKEHARHGVAARVRGEVWLYLLEVLSEDKTAEITSLLSLNTTYQALPHEIPSDLTASLMRIALGHHTKRFRSETYAGLISSLTAERQASTTSNKGKEKQGHSQPSSGSRSFSLNSSNEGRHSGVSPLLTSIEKNPPPPISLSPHGQDEGLDGNDDEDNLNTLRSQLSRILPPPPNAPPSRHHYISIIEEVLGKYYNAETLLGKHNNENHRGKGDRYYYGDEHEDKGDWIYLVTPFICVLSRPVGVFLGFQKLMERLKSFPSIPSRLASFLTLFRISQPELFSYCEDEQVPYVQVAMSWMTTLLAKEMWLGDVLRLWDAYLASDDMFALHCYVCVAILSTCKETLEELDGSEAKLMLLDLPPLDVDRLLQDAANLRVSFPLPRPVDDEA
ncbi:hypothetical protein I302_105956 [Kwoniella bestiolae CBS 10118]|uniref:Rab-GAP TBC domain-containing protein n=1 Tax=Kwoniella bestiolae CBS 10118 TaxID=1296100 RepID=A0A1B9G2L8_9TREE|nr:hypothetical protein I302_05080 [Kwoniella bestiolae CBS 10118]OCF25266.1 hypothetical protein I302_05080 [Kwoniella bestiolae CBS 10118]